MVAVEHAALVPSVDETGRRGSAWMVSVAIHAAVLGGVLYVMRPGRLPTPPAPEALIYVEPAPAAPAPLGVPTGEVAVPPVVETPKPVVQEVPKPVKPVVKKPQPLHAPSPAPALPKGEPLGSAEGVPGGVVGGTPGGLVGGQAGGHGDGPVPADRVAHPPVPIDKVMPVYPPLARTRGVEGVVLLRAIVDRDGRIEDGVTIVQSSPTFDEAAVAAFRRWRFQPGRDENGTAVRVILEIPIRFQLR